MSTSHVNRPTTTASPAKATSPKKAVSPSKKIMSPTKKAISPRKVLFPTKAVQGKSCFKRTVVTSPSKKPSSSNSAKKASTRYFSFATSDNVQVMKIPFIDRSRKVKPTSRIISSPKKPAQDFTKPLEPSKVQKTTAKKLKVTKHAGCIISPEQKSLGRLAEQLELGKVRLPSGEKVKPVEHPSQIVPPENKAPEDAAKQLKLAETHMASEKKLRVVQVMVKSWKQHGAVNEDRLKKIMLHIDKVMTECTDEEQPILQSPMRRIFDELKYFEHKLEEEAAEELEAIREAAAEAETAALEQHDLGTNPPTSPIARTPREILSDQESLQLLMAVKDYRKPSSPKKPAMLTKKWSLGPLTVTFSSLQPKKNAGDDGPGITACIFVLLLVVLVLAQIY